MRITKASLIRSVVFSAKDGNTSRPAEADGYTLELHDSGFLSIGYKGEIRVMPPHAVDYLEGPLYCVPGPVVDGKHRQDSGRSDNQGPARGAEAAASVPGSGQASAGGAVPKAARAGRQSK